MASFAHCRKVVSTSNTKSGPFFAFLHSVQWTSSFLIPNLIQSFLLGLPEADDDDDQEDIDLNDTKD